MRAAVAWGLLHTSAEVFMRTGVSVLLRLRARQAVVLLGLSWGLAAFALTTRDPMRVNTSDFSIAARVLGLRKLYGGSCLDFRNKKNKRYTQLVEDGWFPISHRGTC